MNVTNKKIGVEFSIRELSLIDLSVSFALNDYWNKYNEAKDEKKKDSYYKTYSELEKLYGEIRQLNY